MRPHAFTSGILVVLYCKTNKSYHFLFFLSTRFVGGMLCCSFVAAVLRHVIDLALRAPHRFFCARSFADQTRNLRGLVQIPLAQAAWVESAQLSIQFCLVEIIFVRPNCCRYGTFTTALHVHALHVRVRVWGAHAARAACSGPAV